MATSAQYKLEQQLTCAVCLDIYINPRILPCHHSFCLHCLEALSVIPQGIFRGITCPTCRTSTELLQPAEFPVDFKLNSLKEIYSIMKSDHQQNCSKHDDSLKVFCETCQELICTIADHKNHDCAFIKDCFICGLHDNVQLESTSLVIPFNPYARRITSIRSIHWINIPWDIASRNDGYVIVADCSDTRNSVTVLDGEGTMMNKIRSKRYIRNIDFTFRHGVAITPDNFILVTDEHKIQKITMDGKLVASVGRQGDKPLEFKVPVGIAISPVTGQIFVVDSCNHRIQILNPDLTFAYSFGSEGSVVGQFGCPRFIAIDDQELVYVSDYDNDCIQKFTSEGKFISQFGTPGTGPGQLQNPTGIAISNNLLYVAEGGNHRVSIFTTDGQFVRSFGRYGHNKDQFNGPRGMTFDNEGYLYICDCWNNRIMTP